MDSEFPAEWTVPSCGEEEQEREEGNTTPNSPLAVEAPGPLLDWGDDWDEAEEDCEVDEQGFLRVPPEWYSLWEQISSLLDKIGLKGERLALQDGDESKLLSQLLEELECIATKPMRDWLTGQLLQAIDDAKASEVRSKRLKGNFVSLHMKRIQDTMVKHIDSEMQATVGLFVVPPLGRRVRHRRAGTVLGQAVSRESVEAEQGKRWSGILSNILLEAGTPSAQIAAKAADPRQTLLRFVGKTRASTLKGYLKSWMRFTCWLRRVHGICWPQAVEQVMDFLEVLSEDVKPSVPQSFLQAGQWMEKAGGYSKDDSLFQNALVIRSFDNLTVQAGIFANPRKQAMRYPFVMLAALELFVRDKSNPIMRRIHAGSLLFRSFGTLRFDDLQNLPSRSLRKLAGMIVSELMKSKTSGPGKRNRELPVAVSLEASVIGTDWLLSFLEDLEEACPDARDYLLESSNYSGTASRKVPKSFEESSADTRLIVSTLRVPKWDNGEWVFSSTPLLPLCCMGAVMEHGGRAVLPSAAIHLEPDKTKRDLLGKWLATGGSADYTRTYRLAVCKMQEDIVNAVRSGRMAGDLREDDVEDRLISYLCDTKGWNRKGAEDIVKRSMHSWDVFYRELSVWSFQIKSTEEILPSGSAAGGEVVDVEEGGSRERSDNSLPTCSSRDLVVPKHSKPGKFMIVYTNKRRTACLHKAIDGCPWTKLDLKEVSLHDFVVPEQYNKRCRFCWTINCKEGEDSDTSSPDEADQ